MPAVSRYGSVVPPILPLAAVLAAQGVSYVLVGSAGLYLRGYHGPGGDIDAVPAPDPVNLELLHDVLAGLAVGGRCPPARVLATADLVQMRTSYGKLDCLLARGRLDWAKLTAGAETFEVCGVPVLRPLPRTCVRCGPGGRVAELHQSAWPAASADPNSPVGTARVPTRPSTAA